MHNLKHISFSYILDRLGVFISERRRPDWPWLTADMVRLLSCWLKPTDVGIEWGSGRSTLWFAKRVRHLTSIEHDPLWADKVRKLLVENDCLETVSYRLEKDAGLVHKPDSRYLHAIDELPEESVDFCLVDGWQRADCCLAAIPKLKPGGALILDNAELYIPRERPSRAFYSRSLKDGFPEPSDSWRAFYEQTKTWRCIWTTNGVGDTALYVK